MSITSPSNITADQAGALVFVLMMATEAGLLNLLLPQDREAFRSFVSMMEMEIEHQKINNNN